MTRYTVVWVQEAEDELADIWLAVVGRSEVTAATRSIDLALQIDAESKGIELAEGLRSFNSPPLRVIFMVRADDRIVEVLLVRQV